MILGALPTRSSVFRQSRSTFEKRFASAGSWRWMSSESKIGCKYIQLRWQPNHSEVTSCTRRSRRSQSAIRSSKGPLYGEKENCCVSTMLSSSSVFTSSLSLMTEVPVLRYAITSKSCGCQAASMSLSAFSIVYSLSARSHTFCTRSSVLGS